MSLWFVIPAHGRYPITRMCLRQLARTCKTLTDSGMLATAVVVADDDNLDIAREQGFATVERTNQPLGRKWNDGYQAAGLEGAEWVVPLGTDDWVDPRMFLDLPMPGEGEIRCARRSAIVSEDATRLARLNIPYEGGDGVRVLHTSLIRPLRYRPAEEDRQRALDTSVMRRIKSRGLNPRLVYHDLHPLQIVDFKSHGHQLNSYDACLTFQDGPELDPFVALRSHYPPEALDDLAELHRV